jgi:PleD family two-component response regulator
MPLTLSTSPQTRGEPPRILVVEEETSLADTVRYNLKREGYAVTVAPDGRATLERFRAEAPTLVILDLMLPDVSSVGLVATSGTITTSRHRVWHGGCRAWWTGSTPSAEPSAWSRGRAKEQG